MQQPVSPPPRVTVAVFLVCRVLINLRDWSSDNSYIDVATFHYSSFGNSLGDSQLKISNSDRHSLQRYILLLCVCTIEIYDSISL